MDFFLVWGGEGTQNEDILDYSSPAKNEGLIASNKMSLLGLSGTRNLEIKCHRSANGTLRSCNYPAIIPAEIVQAATD